MTILLSLAVLLFISLGVLFVVLVTQNQRGRQFQQFATQFNLQYSPYATVNRHIRDAHFRILVIGQLRDFRHLLDGRVRYCGLNIFDYSVVASRGILTQTLLILACTLPFYGRFYIYKKAWLESDNLTDDPLPALQPLPEHQKPEALRHWQIYTDQPQSLLPLLSPEVCDWLNAHEELHIEWSGGMLVLYRPEHILAVEQLEPAVNHGEQLIHCFAQQL